MGQQPPDVGTRSPDGRWMWDGQQWLPLPEQPTPPEPPRRHIPPWRWITGILVGLLLIFGVCEAVISSSSAAKRSASSAPTVKPTATPATPDPRGACSPQPCANDNYGWIVVVSDVKYDVQSGNQFERPAAGNVFVTLNVTFTNNLDREQHADPFQFVLLDGAGIKHTVAFFSPCEPWSAVNVTKGAAYGPKCLAFQAVAGKPNGIVLVWTPSFGDYRMKLS